MTSALTSPPTAGGNRSSEWRNYPSWRALNWFGFYRLALALGLCLFLFVPRLEALVGGLEQNPATIGIVFAYLALVLLSLAFIRVRRGDKATLVHTGVFIDLLVFSLLMHLGNGVNSHFGLPMAIAVAAGALLMAGRLSLLFAAFATTGVMAVQIHAHLSGLGSRDGLTQAGLLGATFVMVAILAHVLYRRIQAAECLAASRQVDIDDLNKLNAFIIQRMDIGVLVVDEDRRVRLINAAASALLGGQDIQQRLLAQSTPELAAWIQQPSPDAIPRVGDRELAVTHLALGRDGQGTMLLFLRDQRALLQEAQQIKLAGLGRLTASIAHNIRNPLSAVNHASQLLAESPDLGADERHLLAIIARNGDRIDGIIESVLQLSRGQPPELHPLDLRVWLRQLHAELSESRWLPAERFHLALAADTPPALANEGHLRQIIANLCDNAIKYAGQGDQPPTLSLSAGPSGGTSPPGAFIDVCDDGTPIDPEVARGMFAPFFSTSASGTGLGLYIALELAAMNGIGLDYRVTEAGGNGFRLTLPALA